MNLQLSLLLLLAFWVVSCALATGYPYYVMHPEHDQLSAANPKDDLGLLAACRTDGPDKIKAKCIVRMKEEFFKAEKELLELRAALKECQKGPKPN